MTIEDKYRHFLEGTLAAERSLAPQDLAHHDIRGTRGLRHVLFERGASLDSPFISPGENSFVGAYSYMNDGGYIRGRSFIGRYTSIGRRVTLGAGRHWISGLSSSPALSGGPAQRNYSPDEMRSIGLVASDGPSATCLGCDVWIGDGAVVMPGLSVGHGAVVGANAVVTQDVPPYAIVVGIPARVLRYRFAAPQIEDLLSSRWWDYPREMLLTLPLGNILQVLDALSRHPVPEDGYQTLNLAPPETPGSR